MSQFHFSDEEPKPAPPESAPTLPLKSDSPLPKGNQESAAKHNPFDLDADDEPQKPVVKSPSVPAQPQPVAPPSVPAQPQPVAPPIDKAPQGPKPLQPRPNAAMPPKAPLRGPIVTPAVAPTTPAPTSGTPTVPPSISEVIPPPNAATAATLANDEPTDSFSASLSSIGYTIRKGLDALEVPATWILRVALPLGGLCLAFILVAVFLGNAKTPTNTPQFADLVRNMGLAATGLKFCLIGAAIASLILGYDDNKLGALVAGVGFVLHFLLPIGTKIMVGDSIAGAVVAQQMRAAGFALLIIGLVKATGDFAIFLFNLPNMIKAKYASIGAARPIEAKQKAIARSANMFSPCWNLPFCREAIRKMCPAFLARTTCWKFGRGCYCDEEMIARIVRGESIDNIKAPTRISQTKAPCGRCYIYLEHQTYKFRMLSPLALPGAIVLSYFLWPAYTTAFGLANNTLNSVWGSLSFSPTSLAPDSIKASQASLEEAQKYGASPEVAAYWAQNLIGVTLGFLLLIYISKFIEWTIFKAKI